MKNEQSTLIIISPGFPKDEKDSSCLPSQQLLVKKMNERFPKLKIIILSLDYPFSSSMYKWFGNTVIPFNAWKKPRLKKIFILLSVWRKLNNLQKQHQLIGILSFWCGSCALIGHRFAKKNNLLHRCWILGQDAKQHNKYVRRIKPHPSELMAISDFVRQEFEKNHAVRPAHVLPNGIDPLVFAEEPVERNIDLLAVGSLIPLKQYGIFIEIIHKLKNRFPAVKAVLCGKGPERESLQSLANSYQLGENLDIDPELAHRQVLEKMRQAKLFLHTSNYEGFSTVCIEALYAGAAVISFCKPMTENIPNWYIVSNADEMLYKAIELLSNPLALHSLAPFKMNDTAEMLAKIFDYRE